MDPRKLIAALHRVLDLADEAVKVLPESPTGAQLLRALLWAALTQLAEYVKPRRIDVHDHPKA